MKQEVNKTKGIPGISNHLVRSKNQLRLIAKVVQMDHPNRKCNSFLTKPPNFLKCSYISALRRTTFLTSDDTNTTNKAWKYHDSVITQRKRNKNEELVLLLKYTGFTIHQACLIEKAGPMWKHNISYFLLCCSQQASLINSFKRCFLFVYQPS